MSKNVIELLQEVQTAYDALQAKTIAREQAAAIAEAAHQDEQKAADYLTQLQSELNGILGKVLPAADPRYRVSQ